MFSLPKSALILALLTACGDQDAPSDGPTPPSSPAPPAANDGGGDAPGEDEGKAEGKAQGKAAAEDKPPAEATPKLDAGHEVPTDASPLGEGEPALPDYPHVSAPFRLTRCDSGAGLDSHWALGAQAKGKKIPSKAWCALKDMDKDGRAELILLTQHAKEKSCTWWLMTHPAPLGPTDPALHVGYLAGCEATTEGERCLRTQGPEGKVPQACVSEFHTLRVDQTLPCRGDNAPPAALEADLAAAGISSPAHCEQHSLPDLPFVAIRTEAAQTDPADPATQSCAWSLFRTDGKSPSLMGTLDWCEWFTQDDGCIHRAPADDQKRCPEANGRLGPVQ